MIEPFTLCMVFLLGGIVGAFFSAKGTRGLIRVAPVQWVRALSPQERKALAAGLLQVALCDCEPCRKARGE